MPVYDFTDSVVVVTGAARGLGRAVSLRFADHGADLSLIDACTAMQETAYPLGTSEQLETTANRVQSRGATACTSEIDVRDQDAVKSAMKRTLDRFGRIDVLVTAAGIWTVTDTTSLSEQVWDTVVETNLKGTWNCMKHVGTYLKNAEHAGRIICTGSTASLVGTAGSAHYAASKHGVVGLVKAAALELSSDDITVNAVCPTGMDTPLIEGIIESQGEVPLKRVSDFCGSMNVLDEQLLPPKIVAEAYCWLASEAAECVTGIALPVDAGATIK
jgi:NAD(P)-dependent dehydrogenase (short-subunit alcohol dehydrogenase family)